MNRSGGVRPLQKPLRRRASIPNRRPESRPGTEPRPRPGLERTSPPLPLPHPTSPSRHDERLARPAAYLAKIPPAVAGQRGHDRTFHAACVLVQGFDLTIDEARPLFHHWNLGCIPPWSPAELEHKLHDALRAGDSRPRGYLCDRDSRTQDRTVRRDRPHGARWSGLPIPSFASGTNTSSLPTSAIQAIARMARKPTLTGLPNRSSCLALRLRGASGFGTGVTNFTRGMEAPIMLSPAVKSAPSLRAGSPRNSSGLSTGPRRMDQKKAGGGRSDAGDRGPGRSRTSTARSRSVPRPIPVTGRLVSDVLQALASLVIVPSRQFPVQPAWLPAWPVGIPAPVDATRAGGGDLAGRGRSCRPRTLWCTCRRSWRGYPVPRRRLPGSSMPMRWNTISTRRPRLRCEWLSFLEQIWGTDIDSIAALQEWFGYLLTPDTKQQKILMMVGPKRSGRGTIARVLKALAGSSSVVNPTLSTLARPFGLASFIGKPIAVFPDARLSSRPDNAAIVECLLSISGEDDQTIDRKHMPAWTGKLSTRFVLISNELPRLRDVSGALAGRLIILRFIRSFYGQEDMALFDRLRPELPGILRWAIAGWERLNRRGRFLQPRSAGELVATMDELTSPIAAFLRDRCVVEPDATCPVAAMYESWRSWCQEHGRDAVGDGHSFGRDLHAAVPALTTIRPRTALGRLRHYQGIRLRTAVDPDNDAELADFTRQSQTKNPLAS